MLESMLALQEIDLRGFSPAVAHQVCTDHRGLKVFESLAPMSPANKKSLYYTFQFSDGSSLNIWGNGCAAFSPAVVRSMVSFHSAVPLPPNRLW